MAKSWTNLTKREKVIGVLVSIFAVFTISGVASAINGNPSPETNTSNQEAKVVSDVTYKEVSESKAVPFEKTSVEDSSIAKGSSSITTSGMDGVKTTTYKVTLTNGIETARETISDLVTKAPISEVTSIGTYVAPVKAPVVKKAASNCDPNYSGCVPIASDVDCGGGSGNGPEYLYGTVTVTGSDIYDLDRDGDGIACE